MSTEADFLEKVLANRRDEIERAVRENPSLANSKDSNGVSAILSAIYRGNRDLAEWLADHGANLTLFEASALGRSAVIERLLKENPELVDTYSPDGFTALGLACFFGNVNAVERLLRAGANVNAAARNPMRVAPIHSAGANRDPKIALAITQLLIDAGAEVNVEQHGGWTPLHEAAAHGNDDLVRLLLEKGADKNAQSSNGKTAADLAMDGNYVETAALLIRPEV